jgi:hypothetical protein
MSYSYGANQPYGVIFYGDTTQLQGSVGQVKASVEGLVIPYGEVAAASEMSSYRQMRAWQGVIFGLQMSTFYISMFASGLLRSESSAISVERAQRNYNQAVREYGRNSEQARNALDSLTQAQIYNQRATTMSSIMTVSLGLQAVSMGVSFLRAVPGIMQATSALWAYAAAQAAAHPWLVPAMLAGVAVALAVQQSATRPTPSTSVSVSISDEDIFKQYIRRRENVEAKSATG